MKNLFTKCGKNEKKIGKILDCGYNYNIVHHRSAPDMYLTVIYV